MHSNTSGFSLAAIIAIVAVIGIAGFIGYRVYETNTKNSTSNQVSSNTQSTNQANNQNPNDPQSTTPADTATYLDIKELGVKIKLSDDIKDAVYYYDGTGARVSTQSLIDKSGGTCDPKISAPFGNIIKTSDGVQPNGSSLKANGVNVFQFETSFIVYSTPTQVCSVDSNISDIQTPQLQSFKEALKTIQLDN